MTFSLGHMIVTSSGNLYGQTHIDFQSLSLKRLGTPSPLGRLYSCSSFQLGFPLLIRRRRVRVGHTKDSASVSSRLLEFRMHQDCRKILENLYLHIVHPPLSTWLGSLCKPEEVLFYPKVLPFGSQAASCGLKGLPSFLLCWLFLLGCQSLFFC